MNKFEFSIGGGSSVQFYSSTVAQFTSGGMKYLFYASKEKNHIFIKSPGGNGITDIYIDIDNYSIGPLIGEDNELFVDISEIISALTYKINVDMSISCYSNNVLYSQAFKITICNGYNYANFARSLSIVQSNFCNLITLAEYNYHSGNVLSYILPPTKILLPYRDGRRLFNHITHLQIPAWHYQYGVQNIVIYSNNVQVGMANDYYLPIRITIDDITTPTGSLKVIGTTYNQVVFEKLSSRYIAIRWKCPYTKQFALKTSTTSLQTNNYFGVAFFELFSIKEDVKITELEETASYAPYTVKKRTEVTVGLRNVNAYDYIYYSQIMLSDNVSVCINEKGGSENSFQPAKLGNNKLEYPQNGTEIRNLVFNLIIENYD